jgi:hypothetical protein
MRRAFGTLLAGMMLAGLASGSAMAATGPAGPAPQPAPGGPSVPLCLGIDVLGLDLGQGGCGS